MTNADTPSDGNPRVALIAALDRHHAIGRDGDMPWHLPADLKRFKALTLGKPILMGRKTALSIGRALPGRRNMVLTRQPAAPYAEQEVVASLDAAIAACADAEELMVIGGGEIYALALPRATRLYLTWIETEAANPDTFFPAFDPTEWTETSRIKHPSDAQHKYSFSFVDYAKK